ncbi:type VII secretion target [Nocardioides campestrisoli]|uniref:type VII secretion target n=1 Tax=Nocardioides campestrisoli TaxID=2736757 RepID=UPI00163D6F5E|nr:type VII secretion target [Nocardioides campestrisoli]
MTLEVVPEELRSAANKLAAAAEPLACRDVSESGVSGESFGHVELASWTQAILQYCREANTQLSTAATTMGQDLKETADDVEAGDRNVGTRFDPFGYGLGGTGVGGVGAGGVSTPSFGPGPVAP